MKRLLVVVLTVLGLLGMLALPATANTSKWRTAMTEGHFRISCDGYALRDDYVFQVREQRLFDNDGNLIRRTFHYVFSGTLTNAKTGEFVGVDPGRWQQVDDGVVAATHGLVFGIRIPGRGVILQGVGTRVTTDRSGIVIFQSSGDNHHQSYGDFCAALG